MARRLSRYAILTPFSKADVVAGICAISGFDVKVMEADSGAVVVREVAVPQYDEWDIRNITGPDADEAEGGERPGSSDSGSSVAASLSRLSRYGVVLFDVRLADGDGFEEGVSGEVKARRFQSGRSGEELSSGLLLNGLDPRIEAFLLGELDLSEEEGVIATSGLSKGDLARLAFRGRARRDGAGEEAGNRRASDGSEASRSETASGGEEGQ